MTASQFYLSFVNGVMDLREADIITQEQMERIGEMVVPVLLEVLDAAIADEVAYYEDNPDIADPEHDFHALDDAVFEAVEESYDTSEVM